MPIRSYAIPYIYLKIPMNIFKVISIFARELFHIEFLSSYSLLIFPRVVMCIISFVNDYSMYKICKSHNLRYDVRLLALSSSWIMLTFGIRSFSNSIEMALISTLLWLVSDSMVLSNTVIYQKEYLEDKYDQAEKIVDRVNYFKMKMSLPQHSYNKCALLSTLCVIGIFNRPTFILFGLPIIFHWMIRGFGSRSVSFLDFNIRMLLFILSGLPAFVAIVIIDSIFYGYLSLAQIYIMDISIDSFLVTPVNFIRYNINPENTSQHGEHPKWLHFLVNIPLLFNILGVIAICSFGSMCYKFCKKEFQNLPQTQSFVSLMTSAIFVPVLLLSLFNHQEPRFLIPVTMPLIILHAPKLILGVNVANYIKESQWSALRLVSSYFSFSVSGRFILKVWCVVNVLFTIFFGFIHQAGVVQLANHFSKHHQLKSSTTQIHLVTSHIYNIPESLLILPHSSAVYTNHQTGQKYQMSRRFFLHEYGSLELFEMLRKVKLLIDIGEFRKETKKINYEIFVAIPTSKAFELTEAFTKHFAVFSFNIERVIYPHLSTEAFPNFHRLFSCEMNWKEWSSSEETCEHEDEEIMSVEAISSKIKAIVTQFGLAVYKVEVKRKEKNADGTSS
jgi:GPI mannosyltransferase 4